MFNLHAVIFFRRLVRQELWAGWFLLSALLASNTSCIRFVVDAWISSRSCVWLSSWPLLSSCSVDPLSRPVGECSSLNSSFSSLPSEVEGWFRRERCVKMLCTCSHTFCSDSFVFKSCRKDNGVSNEKSGPYLCANVHAPHRTETKKT